MGQPKVSVVIPAYNHELYVGEAIRSVLDQTFRDFELIIINDGSTDHTEEEILKFKDDRIRYYFQENRGLSATLNRGIELAQGEYFNFLPSDDAFYPEKLEIQLRVFEGNPELGVIFSYPQLVDAEGREIRDDAAAVWPIVPYETKEEIFPALFERNFLSAPTALIRMDCFKKVGLFDESLEYAQDYDLWMRVLKYYGTQLIKEPLVRYRWHGKNLTYGKTERTDFERAVLLLKAIKNLEISDIFVGLKGLDQRETPERYTTSYRALAQHLLKSGLIELVPVAYGLMEEAWKLEPSLELEDEMESLVRLRPHFLDLRDNRLAELDRQMTEQRFKLNRLYQVQKDLERRSEDLERRKEDLERRSEDLERRKEDLERRSEDLERRKEDLERRRKDLEKQENDQREEWQRLGDRNKELTQRTRQVDEREKDLQRWQQELLAVQEKWDRYLRKAHIRILRLLFRQVKSLWKPLPESMKRPVRSLFKERLFPSTLNLSEAEKIQMPQGLVEPVIDRFSSLPGPVAGSSSRVRLSQLKQPKVSVVLPVYNHSHLIEGAIRSVLNQTYPSLELIIVNDGSTDRVNEILPRYSLHDNVTLLQQENLGLPRALTNGFRHATGTFLTWTSADNLMLPNQVEDLVDYLLSHPDVDMVYSNVEIINDSGDPALNTDYRRHNQCPPGSGQVYLPREVETLGSIEDNFINASFLYRASVGKVIGEYDPCLLGTEDYDYWLRVNSLFTIRHLDSDEILYQYRVHADSLSERFGKSDIFENAKKLIRYHRDRETYYHSRFDVFILGNQKQTRPQRREFLAKAFGDQGHAVTLLNLDSERPGEVAKKILSLRHHPKALVLLTVAIDGIRLDELRDRDIFIHADMNDRREMDDHLLKSVDAISVGSPSLLDDLSEEIRNRAHLIKDGIVEKRLLRKARDNFYLPHEWPWASGKNLAYVGPLTRESFDSSLFQEVALLKKDWNFMVIGSPGEVDNSLVDRLVGLGNVRFMGETPFDESGNLYQSLSAVTALWAPIPKDGKYEERVWELVEMAGLSARPLLLPVELDLSEIPFVFQFKDAGEVAGLLDRLASFKMDHAIFDQWLSRNTWDEKAKWFLAIANNGLYYRKTREPIKKERKLLDVLPRVYQPSDGKINVLVQTRSLERGGLEEVIFNLINHFDYRKINVVILCEERGGAIAGQCRDLGIVVKVLGEEKEKEYRDLLKKYSIGLVNPHYATFGLKIAHEMGVPVVPVLHNTYVWFDDQEIAYFKSCDPYISKYIAVSENVAGYTVNRFGVLPEKVQVISNGLDVLKHQAMMARGISMNRASLGIGNEDFLFLNVASYDGRKGHHALLSALKKVKKDHSGVKVLCVGNVADPGYYAKLQERIMQEGVAKDFILHDYVEDVSSLYPIADAFILPSLIEGWSISVMEAMFYGLPLILTDVGGNRKIIEEVGNGILVPTSYGDILHLDHSNLGKYCSEEEPRNGQALAGAMSDFLTRRDYWKQMGERGKKAVQNRYSIGSTARAYETLFLSLKSLERTDKV